MDPIDPMDPMDRHSPAKSPWSLRLPDLDTGPQSAPMLPESGAAIVPPPQPQFSYAPSLHISYSTPGAPSGIASTTGHDAPTPSSTASASGAPSQSSSSSAPAAHTMNLKRRRGLGVITPNACTECRKKRAKCDGQKPCGRCKLQTDAECVYAIPVRQSKENLRSEIEQLRRYQHHSQAVLSAFQQPELWDELLPRLRNGQSVDAIYEWLEKRPAGPTLVMAGGPLPSMLPFSSAMGLGTMGYAIPPPPCAPLTIGSPKTGMQQQFQLPSLRQHEDAESSLGGRVPLQSLLARSDSHPDMWAAEGSRDGLPSRFGSWGGSQDSLGESRPPLPGVEQLLAADVPELYVPPTTWTEVTSDMQLVQHLLALYFCWEYPTFASLSKEHFLRDFQEGRRLYCSSILVNALLALGCRFSNKPQTRANPDDPHTSGEHFFQESQRLYHLETDHHSLTTIQALGIMSIREASCGRDAESWYYAGQSICLAIEMGLHRADGCGPAHDEEGAVQSATFWGAFALDHAWSLATGSLPHCSRFLRLPAKPAIIDDVEASLWIPYTDDGVPLQRPCEQPSNVRSVYTCFCELSELVHQSLYMLHSPGQAITSRELLNIYTQYLNWYDHIPEVLRLGQNFTPSVLFAHMYYHFAILLLFRPLIKLRIIGSAISPRDVCFQAAGAIQGLVRSYSQLYTLRRTPSFVPYFVLTSCITHLTFGANSPSLPSAIPASFRQAGGTASDKSATQAQQHSPAPSQSCQTSPHLDPAVSEAMSHGIADLAEMAPCHHFAQQALNILRYLARKWNIDVDICTGPNFKDGSPQSGPSSRGRDPGAEHKARPGTSSLNSFSSDVNEADLICAWGPAPDRNVGAVRRADRGKFADEVAQVDDTLENPIFWPFPMQGRPMLYRGPSLKDAGFELL